MESRNPTNGCDDDAFHSFSESRRRQLKLCIKDSGSCSLGWRENFHHSTSLNRDDDVLRNSIKVSDKFREQTFSLQGRRKPRHDIHVSAINEF